MARELLPAILRKLDKVEPEIQSKRLAAVAIIIAGSARPSTLLIRRAERSGDPWSGQVAFPGGKMSDTDRSAEATAVRETIEELGVDLSGDASFAGYYRPFRTHTGEMDVIPVVFRLLREVKLTPNAEVSGYMWVELEELLLPSSASTYHFEAGGAPRDLPAFLVGDYVIWGLTHRILSSLLAEAST